MEYEQIMLTEKHIYALSLTIKVPRKKDWRNVVKSIDEIKLGKIERKVSLPVEMDEALDKIPRRIFRFKNYRILISPSQMSMELARIKIFAEPPPKKKKIVKKDVLQELQNNFNLLLGVFLGARPKTPKNLEVEWTIRFEFPFEQHFVQNTTKASFMKKLKDSDPSSDFSVTEIMIVQRLSDDKRISFEILEDKDGKNYIEIKKGFKSPPTTLDVIGLVQDSIRIGSRMIDLVEAQ